MPFYPAWNPKVGGSFIAGARWIYKNIGTRPTSSWTLDIIKHAKGFVPGNLRWADKKTQKDNQQHRMIGKMTDMEFAVEARRRGWVRAATALGYHDAGITNVDVKVLVPAS